MFRTMFRTNLLRTVFDNNIGCQRASSVLSAKTMQVVDASLVEVHSIYAAFAVRYPPAPEVCASVAPKTKNAR